MTGSAPLAISIVAFSWLFAGASPFIGAGPVLRDARVGSDAAGDRQVHARPVRAILQSRL